MAESLLLKGQTFACDPALRGYRAIYRENELNRCPGCGRTHWYVGRSSAECAFCATALPLQEARSGSTFHANGNQPVFFRSSGRAYSRSSRIPRSKS